MRRLHRWSGSAALVAVAAACGTLEASPPSDGGTSTPPPPAAEAGVDVDAPPAPPAADGGDVDAYWPDASLPSSWGSPNDASVAFVEGGVAIDKVGTVGHAIIYPLPLPTFTSEAYTVWAIVRGPSAATTREFGLVARVQNGSAAIVFGSAFGTSDPPTPFIADMAANGDLPSSKDLGPPYTFVSHQRWKVKLQVTTTDACGKMWPVADAEPSACQVTDSSPSPATGHTAGFYTYQVNDSVLESFTVTVP